MCERTVKRWFGGRVRIAAGGQVATHVDYGAVGQQNEVTSGSSLFVGRNTAEDVTKLWPLLKEFARIEGTSSTTEGILDLQ